MNTPTIKIDDYLWLLINTNGYQNRTLLCNLPSFDIITTIFKVKIYTTPNGDRLIISDKYANLEIINGLTNEVTYGQFKKKLYDYNKLKKTLST